MITKSVGNKRKRDRLEFVIFKDLCADKARAHKRGMRVGEKPKNHDRI
jgi:hypothetical protein